ncbi:hypothetical protein QF042_002412 [Pedobacter sp. W3I1]|uniref:putative polyvalent protein kinase domain-containing protein n=1 Tax=Pedobacter sp. W3I1 TaxID=3042291 RepID=UPI0027868BC4|nr:hypothetical protein [Pedobacter sp. W3I1]MDQ0638847.1 hypothetical protein [Pedobacter sp. W3I1]
MKNIKDELQNIINGDGSIGPTSKLEKVQNFLRTNEKASFRTEKQKYLKSEETICLTDFAFKEKLFFLEEISEDNFISAGAEQRVYRYDDFHIIKINDSIFYEYWLDYFNSLLIHNYFFRATAYIFLGFKFIDDILCAVVKQEFIVATEITDLNVVKQFLSYNDFNNSRNNDYINSNLGVIFEDLHDENVLSRNGILYFIDTIFYLTEGFYSSKI